MRLILIRHGIAEDREASAASGQEDSHRPLTPKGRHKMKQAARGLRKVIPEIELLATSPFKRATQTAGILYAVYADRPQFVELPLLAGPLAPSKLASWLPQNDLDSTTVALVGHEPYLSHLAGWCLSGRETGIIKLKKGAACIIDFPTKVIAGKGVLIGLFQPRDLRRIASAEK